MYRILYDDEVVHDPRDHLARATSWELDMESNASSTLKFTLAPGHPLKGDLALLSADHEVVVEDDGEELFRGRLLDNGEDMERSGSYTCEGQMAYFNDSVLRPYGTYPDTPKEGEKPAWTTIAPANRHDYAEWLIDQHNRQVDPSKRFRVVVNQLSSDDSCTRSSTSYPKIGAELKEKVLSAWGVWLVVYFKEGERRVEFRTECDRSGQRIEFGKNLLDFAREIDGADVVTAIIAKANPPSKEGEDRQESFGLEAAAPGEQPNGMTIAGDRIYSNELVTLHGYIEEQRNYEVETVQALIDAASKDLIETSPAIETIDVDAFDLSLIGASDERLALNTLVRVTSKPHHVDQWMQVVQRHIEADPAKASYTLGSTHPTLTDHSRILTRAIQADLDAVVQRVEPIDEASKQAASDAAAAMEAAASAVTASYPEYWASDSQTPPPEDAEWVRVPPEWMEGQIYWTRQVTTYGDGHSVVGDPVRVTGNQGPEGPTGPEGPEGPAGEGGPGNLVGSSSTDAETQVKVVDIATADTLEELMTGQELTLFMLKGNLAHSPSLDVAGLGPKPISVAGSSSPDSSSVTWPPMSNCTFTYDGESWVLTASDAWLKDVQDAQDAANAASTTASNAQQAATDAAKVATNYLDYSPEAGLIMANQTGSAVGNNVQIKSDSVNIRSGSITNASFTGNGIELGVNSTDSIISMCGGMSKIWSNLDLSSPVLPHMARTIYSAAQPMSTCQSVVDLVCLDEEGHTSGVGIEAVRNPNSLTGTLDTVSLMLGGDSGWQFGSDGSLWVRASSGTSNINTKLTHAQVKWWLENIGNLNDLYNLWRVAKCPASNSLNDIKDSRLFWWQPSTTGIPVSGTWGVGISLSNATEAAGGTWCMQLGITTGSDHDVWLRKSINNGAWTSWGKAGEPSDSGWKTFSSGGWTGGYRKVGKFVHLSVQSANTTSSGWITCPVTLPAGYRPSMFSGRDNVQGAAYGNDVVGNNICRWYVSTSGQIMVAHYGGANTWVDFSTVYYAG